MALKRPLLLILTKFIQPAARTPLFFLERKVPLILLSASMRSDPTVREIQ
jgi:hypothetical protein